MSVVFTNRQVISLELVCKALIRKSLAVFAVQCGGTRAKGGKCFSLLVCG